MIEELIAVLPRPANPVLVPSHDEFSLLERELATQLPTDYFEFWRTYGAGAISDFLGVLRPQQRAQFKGFVGHALHWLRLDAPKPRTNWDPHPAIGGLIPWGGTDNGDVLCWRTIGEPPEWTVTVLPPRTDVVDDYGLTMTRFLSRWIAGDLVVKSFPTDIVHGFAQPSL